MPSVQHGALAQGACERESFSDGVLREGNPSALRFNVMPQCHGSAVLIHSLQLGSKTH